MIIHTLCGQHLIVINLNDFPLGDLPGGYSGIRYDKVKGDDEEVLPKADMA